ncbi:MAG: GNAT family N-acetyltransferase [Saprospiraceae bacterium]|nr:GNAT family N-acetyltransferase [Saprospiraceae bacterium]
MSEPALRLQLASPDDIPAIRDLAHRIWREHYPDIIGAAQVEYMLDLNYSAEALARQMAEGQEFLLVADGGSAPIGFIAVSEKGPGQYFIHKFYLDNGQRGRGLGHAAFGALLALLPEAREIRLTVNRQNYKSINFYFKTGFVIEQCLDIEIGSGFVMNDFQMIWRRRD